MTAPSTFSDLLRASSARGESVASRPGGRAHLHTGRSTHRPVCGTRTRRLYPVGGRRPKPCRRCLAVLARAGVTISQPSTRDGIREQWSDLTVTDLHLSSLMAQTAEEANACAWLAGLLFDAIRVPEVPDPAGRVRPLADHQRSAVRARNDITDVGRVPLTVAEDEADLDAALAAQDAKEKAAHQRRKKRALQRAC